MTSKLPVELLQAIFDLLIPPLPTVKSANAIASQHTLDFNAPPWSLTRVCRYWRLVALGHTALWANVIFPAAPSPLELRLGLVQLDRAGQYPLSFSLGYMNRFDSPKVLKALYDRRQVWKHVHIPGSPAFKDVVDDAKRSFPLLESVACRIEVFDCLVRDARLPRLCSISFLGSWYYNASPPAMPITLVSKSQLTTLGFCDMSYDCVHPVLSVCAPGLVSLELYSLHLRSLSPTAILFPSLRRLWVHGTTPPYIIQDWDCPCLEELVLLGKPLGSQRIPPSHLITSVQVSWDACSDALLEYLAQLSRLERLQVTLLRTANEERVDRLFSLLSDVKTCPRLWSVSVQALPPLPRIAHQIGGFIQLVRIRGNGLRHASLSVHNFSERGYSRREAASRGFDAPTEEVKKELRSAVQELWMDHPHLDLSVEYECDRNVDVESQEQSGHCVREYELW